MTVINRSTRIPTFRERWDPSDNEYIWISWTDLLNGETIAVSEWTLPTGWTSSDTLTDQTVEDEDGVSYDNCNGNKVSTSATSGKHTIANKVTLSDARVYERSVNVIVSEI